MIAVRLRGGLGNQLFQYATGRALSLRLGTDLALDLRDWRRGNARDIGLHHFDIQTVEPQGLPIGRGDTLTDVLGKILAPRMATYRETSLGYDPGLDRVTDDTLLKGYWQTERYFSDQAETIRRDLRLVTPPGAQTARLLEEIAQTPAVSLHIRRGDYVSNAKYNAAHGTTGLEYYARAADAIAGAMDRAPVIYAFSDDPDWVRDNLTLPHELRLVDHNTGATAHDDLRLMAACRHHIIANSSFSWWGAWLNPRPDKQVVAPKLWFGDPAKVNPDITPPGWLRL